MQTSQESEIYRIHLKQRGDGIGKIQQWIYDNKIKHNPTIKTGRNTWLFSFLEMSDVVAFKLFVQDNLSEMELF